MLAQGDAPAVLTAEGHATKPPARYTGRPASVKDSGRTRHWPFGSTLRIDHGVLTSRVRHQRGSAIRCRSIRFAVVRVAEGSTSGLA